MKHVIGIDLGGTNIKGVVLNANGEVIKQHYIPTGNAEKEFWQANVKAMVQYLIELVDVPIQQIGMAAPGLPDASNQCIAFLPNKLPGIENFNWSEYLGVETTVFNDAHAALMAETSFGIAQNQKHVVLLTLGTGVGGGILIDGKLYQGLSQMAGHLGHMSLNSDTHTRSIVGMIGSLEYAVGNYSLKERSNGVYENTWQLIEALKTQDPWAQWIWMNSVHKLAVAMASLSNILSPQSFVLSGGITQADDLLFKPLEAFMDQYEWRPGGKKTAILQATFGDMAGAIGAASYHF